SMSESGSDPDDVKKAPGGIRDIEFTVQMLQLVHGRHDVNLRRRSTLRALTALRSGDYLTRDEYDELTQAYVFLRRLEHLIQLWDLRQTHKFPTDTGDRRRLAAGLGLTDESELVERLKATRAAARTLHERIYFRPILESMVGSPSARLGPERANERLTALGFSDPHAAALALADLTRGLSRRSRAMQQMLPLLLDWLSLSPDPDLGLSQLRLLLAKTPDHSQLVTMLLNDPVAGERLCLLLGTARLVGDLMDRIPEFIPRLRHEDAIDDVRSKDEAIQRLMGLLDSRPDIDDRIGTIRRFARRRRLRIAARDILHRHEVHGTIEALSDTADAAMLGAVRVAMHDDPSGYAVIAMGRWGGAELSYGSDLDVMYVFDAMERDDALAVPTELRRILSEPGRHGEGYELDAGLRPEGKNGPIARSLDSYIRYYEEWAEPWELLALTRARPVAGDPALGARFLERLEPVLWKPDLAPEVAQAIRLIKARVETERIDPDEDADFHLKLGPGSLSDIEFVTQLLQLEHGGRNRNLRSASTLAALDALHDAGHITEDDHAALTISYEFCTMVRLRLHLQRGRLVNSLPTDPHYLAALASSLGYDRTFELRERYRQVTRRARRVFIRHFFE
ncbi:MAG: bifunctional glutamine-synthetase adenylyltransferase/deadenyltransferase, partial [Acidimicrobiia bacterium]|nr:bifunctional glutamine-synthetase adenylyltransferase/deadenyltransferase [Acidimicrobiia bacterium]